MPRRSTIVVVACLAFGVAAFWQWRIVPIRRHMAFCDETRVEFMSLASKRPHDVSPRQWDNIVFWTLNAHGNCLTFSPEIPQPEHDRFLADLRERLRGPVDLESIDWIWDELVRLTSNGKRYSDRYRPTTPERLQEFE